MKTILRRIFAAVALLAALLATPLALATPTITINAPANASTVAIASTPPGITFTVTPLIGTSPVGTLVSSVNFLVNGTSIGIVGGGAFSTTYSTTWVPTAPGTYNLTAVVTDTSVVTSGATPNLNTATSPLVIVTVSATRVVVVTAPATNTTLIQNTEIFLRATAALSDSIIGNVQFRLDGADLGAPVTQAPYSRAVVLSAANGFTVGAHTLVARTTSSDGTITLDSSTANITVVAAVVGNAAPVVTMTSPVSGASLPANQSVTVSATATDADGFIPSTTGGGVSFYVDGDLIGTDLVAPYSVTWTPTVAKTYSIRAQATDDKGSTVLSAVPYNVTVVAAVTAPTITFTPPSTVGVNTVTTLTATATAGTGATITQVQFLSGATVLGTDTTAPYTLDWTPTVTGAVSLTARITDSNGTTATSTAASVTVAAAAPTVAITVPTNGTSVALGTTTALTATAVANGGAIVSRVDFLAGTTSIGTALSTPFTVNWTPTTAGITALTARVTDSNGVSITSVIVNVNVTAPSVALTAPAAGSGATLGTPVTLTATASAVGAATVTKVDFFAGATLVGTDTTAPYTFDWTPTAIGAVSLTARVTDSNTAAITSTAVSVTVATSVPTVSLTSHANGASVALGTSPTLTATAAAFGGATVTRVDFLVGSTVVGSSLTAPYSTTWTPTASGVTALTARVTDSNGTTVTSASVNVTVTVPSVALTAPTSGAGVTLGVAVALTATASSVAPATVTKVDFFAGATLVGTALNAPYTVNWTPTASGAVSLTARVTDSNTAATTSSAVNVTVATSVPTIVLTSHVNGGSVALGTSPTLTATATAAAGVTVTRVDFLVGSTVVGSSLTAPYSTTWTPTASGVTALTARVTDSNGTTVTSATINVTVTAAPVVALTAPTAGAGVTLGVAVALTATASASGTATVSKVEFFAGVTLVGTALNAPYTVNWTPTATGSVSLTARVTDNNTATATSTAVNVTVATSVPTVSLTSHANGASVALGTSPTLSATATAIGGATVTRVDFLVGSTVVGSSLTAPYSTTWTPTASGVTALTARVTDSNGTTVTSATINVTVTAAPVVALTAPTAGAGVTLGVAVALTATASASGTATVSKVEFFAGVTLVGTALNAPYTVNWTPTATGSVSLTARVTDNNTATATSTAVNVTVATSVPTVSLTSHANGASVALGTSPTLTATAAAFGGATVTRVDFLVGSTVVGSSLTAPYSTTWTPTASGVTALTARVTDSNGTTVTSASVNVTVTVPSVALTAPTSGAGVTLGVAVALSATASSVAPATVTKVDFFAGATLVGTALNAPYTVNWTPTASGAVSLTARVTDSNTAATTSSAINVTVATSVPTIVLTSHVNGGSVALGTSPTLTATATAAAGVTVTRVDFLVGSTVVGSSLTAPYSTTWTPTASGVTALTARVTDSNGTTVTSATINVTVTAAPVVALTAPTAGAGVTLGVAVALTATASASGTATVSKVEFFAGVTLVGTALNAPYTVNWTPTATGAVSLTARVTDNNTATSTSTAVSVTVATSVPTVALTSHANGASIALGTSPSLTATATAIGGATVARVDFLVGSTIVGTSLAAPYSTPWTPTVSGVTVLTARVTDSNGTTVTSASVNVTVTAPSVALTAPTAGAGVTLGAAFVVTANATAATPATVTKVDFFVGTTLVGTAVSAPYSVSWTPTANGAASLTARVTDSNAAATTSAAVSVTVAASVPTVALTSHTNGVTIALGTTTPLTATASALGGVAVTRVDFLVGTTIVGTSLTAPFSTTWTPTVAGVTTLTARVTDANGTTVTSAAITVVVTSTTLPVVAITAPATSASTVLGSPVPVTITATASTTVVGTTISRVDFYAGTTLIGTKAAAPFTITWTPTATGTVNLTARAFDSNNTSADSIAVPFIVNPAGSPSITLALAGGGVVIPAGSSRVLTATVADDGAIERVDFFYDGTLLGTDRLAPYNFLFTAPTQVGIHQLTARVTDNSGLQSTSSPAAIEIVGVIGRAPAVALLTPVAGATLPVSSATTITLNAADPDGTISSVQVFVNGASLGNAVFIGGVWSIGWTPAAIGSASLLALATDDKGNTTASTSIAVTVSSAVPPSIVLTAPLAGASAIIATPVTITATGASSVVGVTIARVDFFADNVLIGTDNTAPFSIVWTPTATGNVSLTARAIDSNATSGDSAAVPFSVNPLGTPSITLALTGGGTIIPAGSSRVLVASVADDGALDRVDFYLNGTLIGTDRVAPYTLLFTAPAQSGAQVLTARVVDNSGLTNTSAPIAIEIANVIGSPPTVAFVTPATGAFLPVGFNTTLTLNATDADGAVSSVQVFTNGTLIGNATLAAGIWSIVWAPTAVGATTLAAIATDEKGNAMASAPFVVNVTDATSPTIVLNLTPATAAIPANTTLPAGSTRNVLATVTPANGRAVSRVEFFVNGTKVTEKTVAPYSYRYTASATSGTQVVTVRATDNTGLARDIQQTFVVTSAVGTPPTANLLAPTNGAVVIPNSSTPINLAAAALASSGSITSIQFYANGSPLPINGGFAVTTAPYVASFNPTTTGSYILDAISSDDRGNTTVSAPVTITAAFGTPTILVTAPTQNARATPLVPITFSASATAGTGASVLLVEFLIDGEQVGTRSPAAGTLVSTFNTTFAWTPTTANLGARRLTVRVTDTNSLTATSGVVNLTVANVVGTPPILSGLTPGNGSVIRSFSTVSFIVNAQAGTGATISNVEFFLNGVSIGTGGREQQTNTFRRTFDFNSFDLSVLTADVNTGNYPVPLYAIARDSNGNQTIFPAPTSTPLTLQITPSTSAAPAVSLLSLGFGGPNTVTQGTQFFMVAQPSDLDGTVTSLQLFVNGVATGGVIGNPQAQALVTYTPQAAGVFNLYVVATDDTGNTAISTPNVQLNVTPLVAPSTNLVRPSNNNTITTVGAPVFLEATASGANIAQIPTVQFIATAVAATGQRTTINAQRVGTTTTYRAIWTPTAADSYDLTSVATVSGLQTTSNQAPRVVVNNLVGLAPTVAFTVQGATTSASTINFVATAADPDGSVVSVEFFLNRNTIGQAVRDQTGNTWRLGTSLVGIPLGFNEVVAIARDSSGNSSASPTSNINIVAASSLAPTITQIIASPNSVAFSRQIQLTANASDTDGTLTVQYFANGTSIGTSGNAGTSYQLNWTPTTSGTFTVYAVATDNQVNGLSNTAISPTIQVTVRRNNPIQDDTAFLLQVYSDIANNNNVNPLVLADLADRIAAGTTTRTQVLTGLLGETGFVAPVNLLASYYVLMGQWPTPANYTTLLATARGSLSNAIGQILASNEYFLKYGVVPTTALLNNPASLIPADTFINRLWAAAALGTPSSLQNLQFRSNNVASPTLGRGYNVGGVGLNTALAEFITLTNSTNTALFNQARAAALYYQIDRPSTPPNVPAKDITDAIAVRVAELVKMADDAARADAVLKDLLYSYRYVTFVKHPQSLVVSPRSGAIFSVEALGAPPIIYQWLFNGTPIANANGPILSLTNVDTSRVGTYTVVVTTTAGSATSDPATLTLSNTPTRVANISTRGVTAGGNQALIAGFVVANAPGAPPNQTRQMLIRVIGPSLNGPPLNLNVAGALNNPVLEVYNSAGVPILTNDNWGNQSTNAAASATQVTAIQQATTRVGTFALAPNSQDAVVFATLPAGNYTVQGYGANPGASGVVLIEVYDATVAATTATSPRASNVATRGEVGTGANVLIAGFVINGTASRRMLLRGVGPTLTRFGLGQNAVLADPQLTLKDAAGVTLRTNDDWSTGGDAAIIAAASVSGGAFALANGSKDAAMIIMLPPGAYTVQLSGVGNTTGIGIVEVYDVDP